jgi:hypothetical protein
MAGPAPFGGDPLGYGSTWLNYGSGKKLRGGKDIGQSVELGVQNDIGIDGKFFINPATIVSVGNPSGGNTAVFAALNGGGETGNPGDTTAGVGVFGQSVAGDGITPPGSALTNGIGVAGSCNTGCGVFGQSHYGSGVVGFATTEGKGWGYVGAKLAPTFQNAGVLGQSNDGVGVRGHGGVLTFDNADTAYPVSSSTPSAPGGCFSSGLLDAFEYEFYPPPKGEEDPQWYSKSSQPQLRLVPSQPDNRNFPDTGTVGDFFLGMNVDRTTNLYLCLSIDFQTHKPVWSRVMLDFDFDGGTDLDGPGRPHNM